MGDLRTITDVMNAVNPEDISAEELFNACLDKNELSRLDFLIEKSSNRHIRAILNMLDARYPGLSSMLLELGVWEDSGNLIVNLLLNTYLKTDNLCDVVARKLANSSSYRDIYSLSIEGISTQKYYAFNQRSLFASTEIGFLNFLLFIGVISPDKAIDKDIFGYTVTSYGEEFIRIFKGSYKKFSPTNVQPQVITIDSIGDIFPKFKFDFNLFSNNKVSIKNKKNFIVNFLFPKRESEKWWQSLLENAGLVLLVLGVLFAIVKHSPVLTLTHLFYALIFLLPKFIK